MPHTSVHDSDVHHGVDGHGPGLVLILVHGITAPTLVVGFATTP